MLLRNFTVITPLGIKLIIYTNINIYVDVSGIRDWLNNINDSEHQRADRCWGRKNKIDDGMNESSEPGERALIPRAPL